jgi:hypothetical protein
MNATITYAPSWRAAYWEDHVASREAWFVTCPDHPDVGKDQTGQPWGYYRQSTAAQVRTRHIRTKHQAVAAR